MDQQDKDSLVENSLAEDSLNDNFLVGVGHPLLDVSINCDEKELISEFKKASMS
ncbi:hypothetical protein RND71_043360 [Anisodus tanguticus]|uniref:Uncharacterized protein n=1 Tax=Anisodus tanguticus TaxID=243964 RepID=A0AAE1QS56_9SOLA|nr:hypothetical protein RND71_043360 [Anisodus tanguticus]